MTASAASSTCVSPIIVLFRAMYKGLFWSAVRRRALTTYGHRHYSRNVNPGASRPRLTCAQCGHVWMPRFERGPRRCPKCHSPRWNSPRWTETKREAVSKALAAYLKAEKGYHDRLGECCGVTWLASGRYDYTPRKAVSHQETEELDKLALRTEEKRQAWIKARRL
jgi:hypothetical protein